MACTVYTRSNKNDENNGTQLHLQREKNTTRWAHHIHKIIKKTIGTHLHKSIRNKPLSPFVLRQEMFLFRLNKLKYTWNI